MAISKTKKAQSGKRVHKKVVKRTRRRDTTSFRIYISKLFKEMKSGDHSLSGESLRVLDSLSQDWLQQIIDACRAMLQKSKRSIVKSKDVKLAFGLLLGKEKDVVENLVKVASKAQNKFETTAPSKKKVKSQDKAGITFSPARVQRIARNKDIRIGMGASVFIAAGLEHIVQSVLTGALRIVKGMKFSTRGATVVKEKKRGSPKTISVAQENAVDKAKRIKSRHILWLSTQDDWKIYFTKGFVVPGGDTKQGAKVAPREKWEPKANWKKIADALEEDQRLEDQAKAAKKKPAAKKKAAPAKKKPVQEEYDSDETVSDRDESDAEEDSDVEEEQPKKAAKGKAKKSTRVTRSTNQKAKSYYGDEYFSSWF